MTPVEILIRLKQSGCQAIADGEKLRVRGHLPEDLRQEIRQHKEELLALLRYGIPVARLYPWIGKKVKAPRGEGKLVQVFRDRAAIAFGDVVVFYRPDEVEPMR